MPGSPLRGKDLDLGSRGSPQAQFYGPDDLLLLEYFPARLQQAEKKYRSIFENSIGGIFQATPEGHIITANYALARIFGYDSPRELIATLADPEQELYVSPWNLPEFIHLMQKNDVVTGFETQVYRKNGSRIRVSEYAISVRDTKGNLLYYEGIIEDITERKRSEEELKRSREQLCYLSAHLESAREKERIYVAREVHDELGQILKDFMEAIATGREPKSGVLVASDTITVLYAAYVSTEQKGSEVEVPLDQSLGS